jgi:serine/threonine protein kinase/WD40 repeat protein
LLGQLPERIGQAVGMHLEKCPNCEAAAQQLDDLADPVMRELRRACRSQGDVSTVTVASKGAASTDGGNSLLPEVPPVALPETVAGYTLLKELGRGGMGVVYQARQICPARVVALKVLLVAAHADAERRARFLGEADAIARLQHPGIVQVYEVGQHDGLPFLALKYVAGGSLAERIKGQPQPPRQAAELVEALSGAVQHAHERGIVHRDLKPANILLASGGREPPDDGPQAGGSPPSLAGCVAKITDFGLAKQERPELTATGAILGTPSYMAPEQAAGDKDAVGPAADVYALGAILYELLTGRPPFQGVTALQTLEQVRSQEPVAPSQLQAQLPRDVSTICLKCLQKEPRKRYASALDLAEDLRRFLEGRPIRARAVGVGERVWRWSRRNPVTAALAVALALALVAGTVLSICLALWPREEADEARAQSAAAEKNAGRADRQKRIAQGEKRAADQERRAAERQLYLTRMALTRVAYRDGDLDQARALLAAMRPLPGRQDCRHFEWYHFHYLAHAQRRTFKAARALIAVSPDARRLAAADWKSVTVWDVPSGRVLWNFPISMAFSLAFSPDGKRLALGTGPSVRVLRPLPGRPLPGFNGQALVWDLALRKMVLQVRTPMRCVIALAFSPDGKRLAGSTGYLPHVQHLADMRGYLPPHLPRGVAGGYQAMEVCVWDVGAGKVEVSRPWANCTQVAFSPDGRRLLAGAPAPLRVWDFAQARETSGPTGQGHSLAFSGDGKLVAALRPDENTVTLNDAATGKPVRVLKNCPAPPWGAVWSPDGRRLACAGKGWVTVWDVAATEPLYTLQAHTGLVTAAAFSANGRVLVTSGKERIKLWDAARGNKPQYIQGRHWVQFNTLAFTPDGRRLAVKEAIYDLRSGKVLRTFPAELTALSPDGRFLAGVGTDKVVRLWDSQTGHTVRSFAGHTQPVISLRFSKDGRRLASSSSTAVKVWDARSGKEMFRPSGNLPPLSSICAFSPDCRRIAFYARGNIIVVYDLQKGREDCRLKGHKMLNVIRALAFSPDGSRLASAVPWETVRLWDWRRARQVFVLPSVGAYPHFALVFSADGKRLAATGRGAQAVRVWDTETGQETLTFEVPSVSIAAAFSRSGRRLAITTGFGVTVWGAQP